MASGGHTPPDVVVVGAGILGLAVGNALLQRHPRLAVTILDKEQAIGAHQTGHNSGVVHRGVYYAPGSLKARLCVAGASELLAFCDARGIGYREVGKLIVAVDESETERLAELERRARANGVPGVELIGPGRMREIEPAIAGVRALHSPRTAVVDFSRVARAYGDAFSESGGELRLGVEVRAIRRADGMALLETSAGDLRARRVVACAGLQSDILARRSPGDAARKLRIIPFRGDYYTLAPATADRVRGLVYPVPDPRFPFLGVHFTRTFGGAVWAGPNAVLAFAREGYGRFSISPRETAAMLAFPGFWRMAGRYWRTGLAEMWRDYSKAAFLRELRRYMPSLTRADLLPGPSGVRAQAVMADGSLVDDFALHLSETAIHVLNAPSPAATSSLAIGRLIADRADEAFGLAGRRRP